jgi:hypothetical protein
MLNCEKNTKSMEKSIRGAFREYARIRTFDTAYEHGQWWVILKSGLTYSVGDSNYDRGFCFEEVSHGDEE